MTEETLADLMASVGLRAPAWQGTPQNRAGYRPPRPLPRTMRPAEQRLYDPNAGVRSQAMAEQRFRQNAYADTMANEVGRNEVNTPSGAYFGQDIMETTGAPSLARGVRSLQRNEPGQAAFEFGMGGLGALGTATLPFGSGVRAAVPRAPMAEPPPRLPNAPPRLPGRATDGSVLPIRQPEPIRQSLVGGSNDLAEAASMRRDLPRVSEAPDAGQSGAGQQSRELSLPQAVQQVGRDRGPEGLARYRYAPPEARGQTWDFVVEPDAASAQGLAAVQMQLRFNGRPVPIEQAIGSASPEEAFAIYRALQETLIADAVANQRPGYYITGSGRLGELHERFAERLSRQGMLPPGYSYVPREGRRSARILRDRPTLSAPAAPDGGASGAGNRARVTVVDGPPTPRQRDAQATRHILVEAPDGRQIRIGLQEIDGRVSLDFPQLPDDLRGQGIGSQIMEAAAADAVARGKPLVSGGMVSPDGMRLWEALERRGYDVRRGDHTATANEGYFYAEPYDGRSIFETNGRRTDAPNADPPRPRPPRRLPRVDQ